MVEIYCFRSQRAAKILNKGKITNRCTSLVYDCMYLYMCHDKKEWESVCTIPINLLTMNFRVSTPPSLW